MKKLLILGYLRQYIMMVAISCYFETENDNTFKLIMNYLGALYMRSEMA